MAASKRGLSLRTLGIFATLTPGVWAIDDLAPVIASSAIAVFFLLILILMLVYALSANSWIQSSMKLQGKIKLPRAFLAKKKEAKRRLVAQQRQTTTKSHIPPPTIGMASVPPTSATVTPTLKQAVDKGPFVHEWNRGSKKEYEEKEYTMDIGDDIGDYIDEEKVFQIETTLVDNEVLDVGPFKNISSAQPVDGNVYNKPYLYTSTHKETIFRSSEATGGVVSNQQPDYNTKMDLEPDLDRDLYSMIKHKEPVEVETESQQMEQPEEPAKLLVDDLLIRV